MDEPHEELLRRLKQIEDPGSGMIQDNLPLFDVVAATMTMAAVAAVLLWWVM
ncbi:hypothetical protein ACIQMV_31065 [Streptomyces sp. NPDC091412]|uniref:hypothetical protein n=1 Tax=Streptomyces sp. NPDC091412 TaxID=3366002 RepID=UPI0037F93DB0